MKRLVHRLKHSYETRTSDEYIYDRTKPTPLLTRLPPEIRALIWDYVLSDMRTEMRRRRCSIALTCRLVYSETINILYTHTRLDSWEFFTLRCPLGITPAQWSQVQFLQTHVQLTPEIEIESDDFESDFSYWTGAVLGIEEWPFLCEQIARLPKLRELRLSIDDEAAVLRGPTVGLLGSVKVRDEAVVTFGYRPCREVREMLGAFRCGGVAAREGDDSGKSWTVHLGQRRGRGSYFGSVESESEDVNEDEGG